MDQEKKSGTGAPSSDTTSALFVSQRKKQLEQQEADRRAQEKEEQRRAAEAEVRRLEQEVEERKRNAEEEAKRVAEDARNKKAQAEANPDSVLGAPPPQKEKKERKLPGLPAGDGTAAKPMDVKKLAIIGGAALVVVILIIVIATMGGGDGDRPGASGEMIPYSSVQQGFNFEYPKGWQVDETTEGMLTIASEDMGAFILLMDITSEINEMTGGGMEIIAAVEAMLQGVTEELVGGPVNGLEPQLQKTGSFVTGNASFTYQDSQLGQTDVDLYVTALDDHMFIDLFATTDADQRETAYADYRAIMDTLVVTGAASGAGAESGAAESAASTLTAPAGYQVFTGSNGLTMIYPDSWKAEEGNEGLSRAVTLIGSPSAEAYIMVANYADEAASMTGQAIFDSFRDDALGILGLDISVAKTQGDVKLERTDNNGEHYYQVIFFPNDYNAFLSTYTYNDDLGTVQGVMMLWEDSDEEALDIMDAIMASIETA